MATASTVRTPTPAATKLARGSSTSRDHAAEHEADARHQPPDRLEQPTTRAW